MFLRKCTKVVAVALILMALAVGAFCRIYIKTHPLVFNESFFEHAHCIAVAGMSLKFTRSITMASILRTRTALEMRCYSFQTR